ncbi:MAG: hypothetical protein MZV63_04780 [Marinilabiliales bacterium]|nr:hypothetical protein [Marinilabiliales bacterium]
MIGSASGKRNISSAMLFLLNQHVVPIFAVPRKPFSQASIEGNNSVFARLFWNRNEFSGVEQIDEQLEWFNESSLKYTNYIAPINNVNKPKLNFQPEVIFIRQVGEKNGVGGIDILNERLPINQEYINYFVLARWSLKEQILRVYLKKKNAVF